MQASAIEHVLHSLAGAALETSKASVAARTLIAFPRYWPGGCSTWLGLFATAAADSRERIRHPAHRGMLPVLHFDPVRRPAAAVGSIIDRAPACLRGFYCGDPRDAGQDGLLSWRVLHAPISVTRSAAEFGRASSA